MPLPPAQDDGEEFALFPGNSAAMLRWKAEQRRKSEPLQSPCTYTRADPPMAGPKPGQAQMVDLGCAAKSLFGH